VSDDQAPTATDLADLIMSHDGNWDDGIEAYVGASLGESPDDAHARVMFTLTDDEDVTLAAFRVTIERTMPAAEARFLALRCPHCNSMIRICGEQDTDPAWHTIECTNLQCTAQWDSAGEVGS
jgi:hypothetical protein